MNAMEVFNVLTQLGGLGLLFGIFERLGGMRAALKNLEERVAMLEKRKVIIP